MKKFLALLLSLLIIFSLSINSFAAFFPDENSTETNTYYFDDGSYIVVELIQNNTARATKTTSGSKISSYYSSDNELQWSATLNGTFSFNGSSATCTASSISCSISDSAWKITSSTASKTGNKAIGHVVAKRYFLGIPTFTLERDITLTCSASGVLS